MWLNHILALYIARFIRIRLRCVLLLGCCCFNSFLAALLARSHRRLRLKYLHSLLINLRLSLSEFLALLLKKNSLGCSQRNLLWFRSVSPEGTVPGYLLEGVGGETEGGRHLRLSCFLLLCACLLFSMWPLPLCHCCLSCCLNCCLNCCLDCCLKCFARASA